jgi:hypothetical protein
MLPRGPLTRTALAIILAAGLFSASTDGLAARRISPSGDIRSVGFNGKFLDLENPVERRLPASLHSRRGLRYQLRWGPLGVAQ